MFGPLTYFMLAVATIAVPIGISLQIAARVSLYQAQPPAPVDPDLRLANILDTLEKGDPPARIGAIASLGEFSMIYGYVATAAKTRAKASAALIGLLKSPEPTERASAAEALGRLALNDDSAVPELTALLKDNDQTVRFAAASALIRLEKDKDVHARALGVLTEMAEDEFADDRKSVLSSLWNSGEPGQTVVLKALSRLLASKDPFGQSEGIRLTEFLQIGSDRLLPVLAPLLKSTDVQTSRAAAEVIVRAGFSENPGQGAPDPALISVLERVVVDTALPLDNRVSALSALTQSGFDARMGMGAGMAGMGGAAPPWAWPALRRCALELARQLDHKTLDTRIAAGTLLHMIDPETLAGKNLPGADKAKPVPSQNQ
jgi:hypothetical protein